MCGRQVIKNALHMSCTKLYVLLFLVFLSSCSEDFDLNLNADSIPVVYFQMNPDDHVNYLTLTRSFTGNTNAFDMARNPQLVYYDDATIFLEGWVNNYKIWETKFNPSDRVKSPGIFAESSGYCYEGVSPTEYGQMITHYRLVVTTSKMASPLFSKIGIFEEPVIKSKWDKQICLYPDNYEIGIIPGLGTAYCDLFCVFHYKQLEGSWINLSDTFRLRKDMNFEAGKTDYLYANQFFNKIAANIKPINDTIVRKFSSIDLILYAGDNHLRDYLETYQNAATLDLPPKGNVTNGLGLFTMLRTAVKEGMILDRVSHDSLCQGEITKKLGFVRW